MLELSLFSTPEVHSMNSLFRSVGVRTVCYYELDEFNLATGL